MLRNYVTMAVRNLWKHRVSSSINLFGLAVSLAVCLLLLLFLRDQWRYDRWHDASDRIHRVTSTITESGRRYATSPAPVGPALVEQYAGVEDAVRMDRAVYFARRGTDSYLVDGLFAEPSFFDVFDFRLQAGSATAALRQPGAAVITPSLAEQLFGSTEEAVGRTFTIRDSTRMTVAGITAPHGGPSHFQFEAIYSWATVKNEPERREALQSWTDVGGQYNYILLAEGTAPEQVEQHLATLRQQKLPADQAEQVAFRLQALTDINLGTRMWNEIRYALLPRFVAYFLGALALLIVLAAGFNYVNLTVARSLGRSKEVGVRKSMGAGRGQLTAQFLSESVLMTLLATGCAVGLLGLLVPLFNDLYVINQLLDIPLTLDPLQDPSLILVILGFAVGVGMLAGLYPAVIMSTPDPSRILRSGAPGSPTGSTLRTRKTLIALQFVLTLVFAVTAVMMYRQASYTLNADHGFDTDRLIRVRTHDVSDETFKREAEQLPSVAQVTMMSTVPLSGTYATTGLRVSSQDEPVAAYSYAVDTSFVRDLGIAWAAQGPDASQRFATGEPVVLNARAAQALAFDTPAVALGQTILVGAGETPRTVVGVVEGMHVRPLMDEITPLVLRFAPGQFQNALVRAQSDDLATTVADLKAAWQRIGATDPLNPQPFSEILAMKYGGLQDAAYIISSVALLAVLIAALGLLGIAAYTVRTRTREIGIRKALGASVSDIVGRLSMSFIGLVAVGVVLAVPIAWFLNRFWLQAFAYRVEMGVGPFIGSAAALLAIALLVVGTQAMRAARLDPTTTLRDQ